VSRLLGSFFNPDTALAGPWGVAFQPFTPFSVSRRQWVR
jgi:hypothetical protein